MYQKINAYICSTFCIINQLTTSEWIHFLTKCQLMMPEGLQEDIYKQ
jgi:hypothetical protein